MDQKSIVNRFVYSVAEAAHSERTLLVAEADFEVLKPPYPHERISSGDSRELDSLGQTFDFILAELPLGMKRENITISQKRLKVRKNWADLARSLRLLDDGGYCVALVEPTAFGMGEGPRFLNALRDEGYSLCGIINVPDRLLSSTSMRPVLVLFERVSMDEVFVSELESEAQAEANAKSFLSGHSGSSLAEGIYIEQASFCGFDNLKAQLQLEKLETQYNEYESLPLGIVAVEINSVKPGEQHEPKENAVYFSCIGPLQVTHDIDAAPVKHQHLFQIVFEYNILNKYISAFFSSDLGELILRSRKYGGVISRIDKSNLMSVPVAIPSIEEQRHIVGSYSLIDELSAAIDNFQKEIALNPRNASVIISKIESMLEQIGELADPERVLSLARSGESSTVEFKETYGMDLKKGTKEKYIELQALKTITAFLNTSGGALLIGVRDDGDISGLEGEIDKYYKSQDKFLLRVKNQIKNRVGEQYYPFIDQRLVDVHSECVLMIECRPSPTPCYLDGKEFYVRTNPATDKLEGPRLVEYIQNHFER